MNHKDVEREKVPLGWVQKKCPWIPRKRENAGKPFKCAFCSADDDDDVISGFAFIRLSEATESEIAG